MKPGPKLGYKQSAEHIEKRKRFGRKHHAWKGNAVSVKGGRTRALRAFPNIGPCQGCGNQRVERHHKDGNTSNNRASNIIPLCRKCHMRTDGRLEAVRIVAKRQQATAVAAAILTKQAITHCPKGHPYAGANLYINVRGARSCRQCLNTYKREKRAALAATRN